jgi:hypothetical protein
MKTKHLQDCSAPVCMDSLDNNIVWWAGEEVCLRRPYSELQKRQIRINKEFEKGRLQDKCWTVGELLKSSL